MALATYLICNAIGAGQSLSSVGKTKGTALPGSQSFNQGRNNLVHVADDAEISHPEDRCFRVLIDRDDVFGTLHPDKVLSRS